MSERIKNTLSITMLVSSVALLISGATFAWLTFTMNVTNGHYNAVARDFSINYSGDQALTSIATVKTSEATPSNTSKVTVTASKGVNSIDGNLTIYLNTTSNSNALIADGVLSYAVCVGECATFSTTSYVSSTSRLALVTAVPLTTTSVSYNIYFWYDEDKVTPTNSLLNYTGYIDAEADQAH